MSKTLKNVSERLFEEYLTSHSVAWEYEPTILEKKRKPDYRILWPEVPVPVFSEVKEFASRGGRLGFGIFDVYEPIRKKIESARKKFAEYKEFPCVLVLYGAGAPVLLEKPWVIFASMLGDLGIQFRVDKRTGAAIEEPSQAFLGGGKMRRYRTGEAQNTTISAIVVLEQFSVGRHRDRVEGKHMREKLARDLTLEESLELATRHAFEDQTVLRVVTYGNASAREPLPLGMFRGALDERWNYENEIFNRVFAGSGILELESAAPVGMARYSKRKE